MNPCEYMDSRIKQISTHILWINLYCLFPDNIDLYSNLFAIDAPDDKRKALFAAI